MTAAAQSAKQIPVDLEQKIAAGFRNAADEGVAPMGSALMQLFEESFIVPTTAIDDVNDILRLVTFPPGFFLWDLRATPSDMDTNATPTLVYSLLIIDSADATLHTLVASSTNGQAAAGTDSILAAKKGVFVGGKRLAIKTVTVAATPAAGTYKVAFIGGVGCVNFDTQDVRVTDPSI